MLSIAPAEVNDTATADASEGSIACAEDGRSSPVSFFSTLLHLRNGEVDRRAAPVEEDEEEEEEEEGKEEEEEEEEEDDDEQIIEEEEDDDDEKKLNAMLF
ncbi:uncharacterized protein MONOS_6300 [Monocercomonoides exilis]|uniref:uncharacterized protein n=1 Tax=Monocercomonoides exilis TaxID=2049356 RepID=UPI00355A7AC4|nr:hypothetical protein MONOS_6300 [Monocercomonoides exilis]|eukprot:MONOS_6300.1-p1 / transcript=MONOS_6300.1 / gene=MONOS_6300 / organism=Monocercomonoides_exilis_PA203 / gene_product=unspecified product / transcript_product=unspecified product / location=Mono_scaffold00196:71000-71302(+) / protein_length=101 / sequence_SO=supercontig / SO=protein_coding / is_pseudo=false